MGSRLDEADDQEFRPQAGETFLAALRYEYLFWESAYRGERWPDQ